MKAKQIFFIMAAVVLSLTGCGKQEKEEGNTVTEYFKEAPVTMPEDIVGCFAFIRFPPSVTILLLIYFNFTL